MTDFRSVENARLRTSMTAASRGTAPLARRARSSMVGSRSGRQVVGHEPVQVLEGLGRRAPARAGHAR